MPIDRRGLDSEMAPRGELALQSAEKDDGVEDHTAGHMRAVEASEREEHGAEDAVARLETNVQVLVALPDEKRGAKDDRRDEPVAESRAIAAFDRIDGEVHGDARSHQLERVE